MSRATSSSGISTRTLLLAGGALAVGAIAAGVVLRRRRYFDLTGRLALVTGGSRGLGLVIARELAIRGARVAICARDEDELQRARLDLDQRGADVMALPCDLTDPNQIHEMLDRLREAWGPIDVLVNNAGVIQVGPMEAMTREDYEAAMKVHFWGPFEMIQGVLPDMQQRGFGRIINITSIGGRISLPHLLPYCASKFAMVGLSQGLRARLTRENIYVTTVCPGLMRTGSPRNALVRGNHRKEYAWFSIADSLPGLSMAAERAARLVVDACQSGQAELVMPFPTAFLLKLHALMPATSSAVVGLMDRGLPDLEGGSSDLRRGAESQSGWSPSWITTLSDQAAARNNEI